VDHDRLCRQEVERKPDSLASGDGHPRSDNYHRIHNRSGLRIPHLTSRHYTSAQEVDYQHGTRAQSANVDLLCRRLGRLCGGRLQSGRLCAHECRIRGIRGKWQQDHRQQDGVKREHLAAIEAYHGVCDRQGSSCNRTCECSVTWLETRSNAAQATSMLADDDARTLPPRSKSPTDTTRVADRNGYSATTPRNRASAAAIAACALGALEAASAAACVAASRPARALATCTLATVPNARRSTIGAQSASSRSA